MLGLASGVLGWAPAAFWAATPHELFAAVDGYAAANNPDVARERAFSEFKADLEASGAV